MKAYGTVYVINVVFQAIFSLIFQIGLCVLLAYLAVSKLSFPEWVYIPFVLFGTATGLITMIRFILTSMASLERLEKQNEQRSED